jgi:hypothetical protein
MEALKQYHDMNFGNFSEVKKYKDAKQAHSKELALKDYKAGIRGAYFKTAERMRKVNKEYQQKLEETKFQESDLSSSRSFIDIGHAEMARKTIDSATDEYHGVRVSRFFNTCGLKNESLLIKYSDEAKKIVENFISHGRADIALEYAKKIEDAKDFCFFAPIKKSAQKNGVLCSYTKTDRAKLLGILHIFKTDVKKVYEDDKTKLLKQISEKKLEKDSTFVSHEKEYKEGLASFIDQQLDTVLCVPFADEKIDDVNAFKKTYSDRANATVKAQKMPSMEDGVFTYAYAQFQKLSDYCKTLIK